MLPQTPILGPGHWERKEPAFCICLPGNCPARISGQETRNIAQADAGPEKDRTNDRKLAPAFVTAFCLPVSNPHAW